MLATYANSPDFARWPVHWRRRAIRFFWWWQCRTGRAPDLGLAPVFRRILRVPAGEARHLQSEVVWQDLMATLGWSALLHANHANFRRDAARITISDRALLDRLASTGRPIMLMPLHMGSFAAPFALVMRDHFSERPMLILRAREDREEETMVMRRIGEFGIDMRFMNVTEKQTFVSAVRYARKGAVIVCFCDLPSRYGSPEPTELFGKPCRLALGHSSLARITEAIVVPIAVYSHVAGDHVQIGTPYETFVSGPAERRRIVGLVARHIEQSVLADPAQWHMWPRFDEFVAEACDHTPPVEDVAA